MDILPSKIMIRAGGVAQVLECLLCKCEALSSNPRTTKNKRKQKNKDERGLPDKQNFKGKFRQEKNIMPDGNLI
jgi:hypothetical protein